MPKRYNFSEKTKKIIAGRAGYQCSFPGCKKVLIGPGNNDNEITCIGECAHIYSASDGGPRGKTFLNESVIKSPENGIYLCRNHHRIIDANRGKEYSPSDLLSFKAKHEALIARQLGNNPISQGWINRVSLQCRSMFKNDINIRLGKITHLYGTNNSGKTFFCNCIYNSIQNKDNDNSKEYKISFEIDNVSEDKLTYSSDKLEGNNYFLGNNSFPICPINLKVVYLSEVLQFTKDHVNDFAKCFNVDEKTILSVLHSKFFDGLSTKRVEIKIRRTKPYLMREICIINKNNIRVGLNSCASSEVARFLTDVGIILSRFLSYQSMVLYIIDWCIISVLDDNNLNELLSCLESNNNLFQTIIISPDEMPMISWKGWIFAKFQNMVPNTVIEQDEF